MQLKMLSVMLSATTLCLNSRLILAENANSVDPDQTAPNGAV